jgi:hypothetical protein
MKVPHRFERSHLIHDFMRGWGRRADGSSYRVVWLRDCPAVFVLTECQFRRVLIGKELARWWRRLWRRLCRRDRIKLNFGPFTTPQYSKLSMSTFDFPDIRQAIIDNSLKDMATDVDKRWVTTVNQKFDEKQN